MSSNAIPTSDVITVEVHDHIATLWLDRPEQRNAFAPDFWLDLPPIMESLGEDPEVRVVVIAARGDAFTVGIDLKAFGPALMSGGAALPEEGAAEPGSDVARRMALRSSIKTLQRTFSSIADCPKPVIAAVHGYCIGAGLNLVTACDIRYASEDAVFSSRETKIAIVADVGTMQRLPKIIDPGSVAELVYTGRDITAHEALTMGLVTHVSADADSVQAHAMGIAQSIAANSPLAVQGSKAVLKATEDLSVEDGLDYVAVWNSSFVSSNDLTEAISAFVQKRPPEFTGE
jgi:enoyl-CoA hydratase